MAFIRSTKRADGTIAHRVHYRHEGRQTTLTFDDPSMAEVFCAAVDRIGPDRALALHRIERTPRAAHPNGLTVAAWLRLYIDQMTGIERKTVDDYNRYLDADIAPLLGAIPLARLSEADVATWVAAMETTVSAKTGRVVSAKTIKNRHGFLSGALAAAVKAGHLQTNPAAGRRLPKRTAGDSEDRAAMRMLTRDEFRALLDATTEPWKPLLEFMVASGARWGEVAALRPEDVDQAATTVRIRRAWKYSSSGYEIGTPKTARSLRTINIPAKTLAKLDYTHEWLFTNRTGGPVRYPGFRRRVWDRAVERAALTPAPTPHDLRHTCASWMIAAGLPLAVVSRHLGHENIQITVDTYGDVDRQSFAAAATIGDMLN